MEPAGLCLLRTKCQLHEARDTIPPSQSVIALAHNRSNRVSRTKFTLRTRSYADPAARSIAREQQPIGINERRLLMNIRRGMRDKALSKLIGLCILFSWTILG